MSIEPLYFAGTQVSPLTDILAKAAAGDERCFIHRVVHVLPAALSDMPHSLARFRLELFSAAHYAQHGVRMPIHIRNSVAKRQAEFLAGRVCAQDVLQYQGVARQEIPVGQQREPIWPEGYVGSITHNTDYAAAIACPNEKFQGVGIDIESVIGRDARQAMLDLTVSADELQRVENAVAELGLDRVLTLIFSAKESFFKASFSQVQRFFDFDVVEVMSMDLGESVMTLRCRQTLNPGLPVGASHLAYFDMLGEASVITLVALRTTADAAPTGLPKMIEVLK